MFDIIEFQKAAQAVGLYAGKLDGVPGPKTQAAAMAFKPVIDDIIAFMPKPVRFRYEKIAQTHVLRADPMDLRAAVAGKKPVEIPQQTFINANFFSGSSVIGWLISEGKVIKERHEDIKYPGWAGNVKGTFIVYKDGAVEVGWRYDSEITRVVDKIWFCCQGFNLFPPNMTVWQGIDKEGFAQATGRTTTRLAIGYDGKDAVIAIRPDSDAPRIVTTMINLGCKDCAIGLDSGSPATFKKEGEMIIEGKETLQAIIYL